MEYLCRNVDPYFSYCQLNIDYVNAYIMQATIVIYNLYMIVNTIFPILWNYIAIRRKCVLNFYNVFYKNLI